MGKALGGERDADYLSNVEEVARSVLFWGLNHSC
jgi:hypothetical protein